MRIFICIVFVLSICSLGLAEGAVDTGGGKKSGKQSAQSSSKGKKGKTKANKSKAKKSSAGKSSKAQKVTNGNKSKAKKSGGGSKKSKKFGVESSKESKPTGGGSSSGGGGSTSGGGSSGSGFTGSSDSGSPSTGTDTTAPVITLNGDSPHVVSLNSAYTDSGAIVTDDVDTPTMISGTGDVDTRTVGNYTITYSTTDSAGNVAVTVTRVVRVVDYSEMITVQGGTLPEGSQLAGETVEDFKIGKYEVTWGEWKEVRDWAVNNGYTDLAGVGSTYPEGSADNYPVFSVNLFDVLKWCNAKSEMEGLTPVYVLNNSTFKTGEINQQEDFDNYINLSANGYRLPTAKEFVWTTHGGNASRNHKFPGSDQLDDVAWYKDNSTGRTHPVGLKLPNELGVYDLLGNAAEWTIDRLGRRFGPSDNPDPHVILHGEYFNSDAENLVRLSGDFFSWIPPKINNFSGFRYARNTVGKMISVQGGALPAGSELAGETVKDFQIGKYEVTWGEWKEVRDWAVENGYPDLAGIGETYPSESADNFPVVNVNWYDVCKWSNAKSEKEDLTPMYLVNGEVYKTGESVPSVISVANGYRLPLEKEWEWAARGGVSSQGYIYSGSNDVNEVAWYGRNSSDSSKSVGTKAANELGIHDMSGNVWEWCWDVFNDDYYLLRANRGNDWRNWNVRAPEINLRGGNYPDTRSNSGGFRLARSSGN